MNISVATDSLAGPESLSLLGELRALQKTNPWLAPEQLLRTITVNPARALDAFLRISGKLPLVHWPT